MSDISSYENIVPTTIYLAGLRLGHMTDIYPIYLLLSIYFL